MARTVKAPDVRRTEILDAAEHLISTKGYEQMTIQDLLDYLQISKGGFYHHFDSKLALLEAILVRRQAELQQRFLVIVQDDQLPTLAKLQRFFDTLSLWKTAQKALLLPLLQVLYGDDNAVFRQKLRAMALQHTAPLLTEILVQGIEDGVVALAYPNQASEVILALVLDLGDACAGLLLSPEPDLASRMERLVAAYTEAISRVLGLPDGSFSIIDPPTLAEWVIPPRETISP
ncbi:MAG: TetR/AcrR family transcriptional regulator [Ktedonobacterales bacterium]